MNLPKLEDFPAKTYDKIRYGDTDRQGHVNNAVFVTFFETGRVDAFVGLLEPGFSMVIAHISVDYRKEMFWPGTVEIGTGVKAVGRSSAEFVQALFQNGECVATAQSVLVLMDGTTHRPAPIGEAVRARLLKLQMVGARDG